MGNLLRKLGCRRRQDLVATLRASAAATTMQPQSGDVAAGSAPRSNVPDAALATLTASEREVHDLLADGLTNEAIATRRGVSSSTIAKQATSLYRKLGVRGRSELGVDPR